MYRDKNYFDELHDRSIYHIDGTTFMKLYHQTNIKAIFNCTAYLM